MEIIDYFKSNKPDHWLAGSKKATGGRLKLLLGLSRKILSTKISAKGLCCFLPTVTDWFHF